MIKNFSLSKLHFLIARRSCSILPIVENHLECSSHPNFLADSETLALEAFVIFQQIPLLFS